MHFRFCCFCSTSPLIIFSQLHVPLNSITAGDISFLFKGFAFSSSLECFLYIILSISCHQDTFMGEDKHLCFGLFPLLSFLFVLKKNTLNLYIDFIAFKKLIVTNFSRSMNQKAIFGKVFYKVLFLIHNPLILLQYFHIRVCKMN